MPDGGIEHDVVVIGGGQAGLAVSYALSQASGVGEDAEIVAHAVAAHLGTERR